MLNLGSKSDSVEYLLISIVTHRCPVVYRHLLSDDVLERSEKMERLVIIKTTSDVEA